MLRNLLPAAAVGLLLVAALPAPEAAPGPDAFADASAWDFVARSACAAAEVADCGPTPRAPASHRATDACTVIFDEDDVAITSVTTCIRTAVVAGEGASAEDCPDGEYDPIHDKCFDTCEEGWRYSSTSGSCVQDICGGDGQRACSDPLQNPAGYGVTWIERSEARCEKRPISDAVRKYPHAGGLGSYYRVCASHAGTGTLSADYAKCGKPLPGAPGDNTTAQFCFAFTWTVRGGGQHVSGAATFEGAHSDSHDPDAPGDIDTPTGNCAWDSASLAGDYTEVDPDTCLGWASHHGWHFYPGKASGIHVGSTTTRATAADGGEWVVKATGSVSWRIHAPPTW